jgi:integrase
MASVWIERRWTKSGEPRYRVEFSLGGFRSRGRYAGSFKTKREATIRKQWVAGELAALRVPDLTSLREPERAPTFAEAATRWQASRVDVKESTTVHHETALNRALPIIGGLRLDEITKHVIADLIGTLHAAGRKRASIRKTRSAVGMVLDHAGVTPNPARDLSVKLPREESKSITPPDAEHVAAVYHLLPPKHRLPLLWLDWSGTRVGSIDKLTVGDYDEPRRRVRVPAHITKNALGLFVELPEVLADAIEATLPPREDRQLDARLFPESGSANLRMAITRACKAAGVPHFHPHDLRHRRISLLHLRGVPWARIAEHVGQRDLAVTANTYTHVLGDETEVDYGALVRR